jgi:hypothetical protein
MDLWARWEAIYNTWENPDRERDALAYYQQHRAELERGACVLWPEAESLFELMRLRATIGSGAFTAEKQGDPVDPSVCEWPSSHFDSPGFWFDEWPRTPRDQDPGPRPAAVARNLWLSLQHPGEGQLVPLSLVVHTPEDEQQAFLTVEFFRTACFWIHLGIGVYTDSTHAQFIANHSINTAELQLLLEG